MSLIAMLNIKDNFSGTMFCLLLAAAGCSPSRPTPPPPDKKREAEIKKELKLLGY